MTNAVVGKRPPLSALLSVLASTMLVACTRPAESPNAVEPAQTPAGEHSGVVELEVFYRERMLLPPGSELIVALEDVSRMDVAATRISEQRLTDPGSPPYRLSLSYPPEQIEQRHRYGLRAQIRHGDSLLFTNTSHIDPFSEQPVKVLMQRASRPAP